MRHEIGPFGGRRKASAGSVEIKEADEETVAKLVDDERKMAAAVGNETGELGVEILVADLCRGEEAVELLPGLLEHAQTGVGIVTGLLCALFSFEDGLARGLGKRAFGARTAVGR